MTSASQWPFSPSPNSVRSAGCVAEQRPLRPALLGYGVVVAETLIMKLLAVGPYWSVAPWFLVTYLWVFFGAAWIFGRYQRVRAQRVRDLMINAERERVAAAEAAVRAERLRIARELHDVVAHHLSLMTIQAGGPGGWWAGNRSVPTRR